MCILICFSLFPVATSADLDQMYSKQGLLKLIKIFLEFCREEKVLIKLVLFNDHGSSLLGRPILVGTSYPCWVVLSLLRRPILVGTSYPCWDVLSLLGRPILVGTSYPCWDVLSLLGCPILVGTSYPYWDVLPLLCLFCFQQTLRITASLSLRPARLF